MSALGTVTQFKFKPIYDGDALDLRRVAKFLNLSKRDLGKLCGVQEDSIRFDDRMPEKQRRLLHTLAAVIDHVAEIYDWDGKVKAWFLTVNPALEYKSPLDLIMDGKVDAVLAAVVKAKAVDTLEGKE